MLVLIGNYSVHVRVLEEAEEDEGFNSSIRAIALSEENKKLQEKDDTMKAKVGVERKVGQLLKDKHMKELHQQVESELSRVNASPVDAKKAEDNSTSEHDRLSTKVKDLKLQATQFLDDGLEWKRMPM